MTYVITQNCCNDASCVAECPVDCIRPTPDDREAFAAAEMLYIDPDSCIDCGACVEACPVGAVSAEADLPAHLARFAEFNAEYFVAHPLTAGPSLPGPVKPAQERGELAVAVVGAGPSGSYVVDELVQRGNVRVTVYDRLPTPWGLLRSGVAPDHQHTKDLASLFERAVAKKNVTLQLNVAIGTDVTVPELLSSHHAVVLATGAADPQPWDVPGAELPGVHPASDFVAWYNGHPDYAHLRFDLSGERAVVVGNGNVALDMARVLLLSPERLAKTDIADHALETLRTSNIREVVIIGRRGPLQAAYTTAELHALAAMDDVDVVIDPAEAALDPVSQGVVDRGEAGYPGELKVRLASEYAAAPPGNSARRLVLRFLREPMRVHGQQVATGVELAVNQLSLAKNQVGTTRTGATEMLDASLILTSVGYRGRRVAGIPFDERRGTIPTTDGRVVDDERTYPGLYGTGWIRRGAQGGLGSSRIDATQVVEAVITDFNDGILVDPSAPTPVGAAAVDLDGWRAIDSAERGAGLGTGRPRVKLVQSHELVAASRRPHHA